MFRNETTQNQSRRVRDIMQLLQLLRQKQNVTDEEI